MNEELQLLMQMLGQQDPEALRNEGVTVPQLSNLEQPEQELTEDIKKSRVVVNGSRGRNGGFSALGLLQNPEIQNALISFGQAFSNAGNFTGQPNPIDVIGETGRGVITGSANRDALRAFEEGEPIAGSTNRFADPELVMGLQQRRQQGEQFGEQISEERRQFNESINLQKKGLKLDRDIFRNDVILRRAAQNMEADQFNARFELLEREQDVNERLADARSTYWDRLGRAALMREGEGGDGFSESMLLRTNEFLEVLNEAEGVQQRKLEQFDNDIEAMEAETGATGGDVLSQMVTDPLSPVGQSRVAAMTAKRQAENKELQELKSQRQATVQAIQDMRDQQKLLRQIQSQRLAGGDEDETTTQGTQEREQQEETGDITPQGTIEQPVQVTTMEELQALPAGSIVDFLGTRGRLTETGNIDESVMEEEE